MPVPGLGETPYEQLNGDEPPSLRQTRGKEAAAGGGSGGDSPAVAMVRSESGQTDPICHTDHSPSRGYFPPSPRFLWETPPGHELPLPHQGKDGGCGCAGGGGGGLTPSTAAGTPLSLERVDSDDTSSSGVEEGRRTHRRMSTI